MDFKEYRQKAREYEKNKCIIENNKKILEEDGIFVKDWGENSGTLTMIESMSTAEMQEIEKEFNVTVTDVRTLIRNGKKTKFSKGKHAYPGITHRKDKKFAYVRLKQGDSIKVFDEPESETSAKEAKADKKAKKADKNAGKEKK